jgi:hypothetical protein
LLKIVTQILKKKLKTVGQWPDATHKLLTHNSKELAIMMKTGFLVKLIIEYEMSS